MICGIAILAVPVCLGSLTQLCQQELTAGGSVPREEQGLRPASRNGFPRRADQRKHEQATGRYFGYFQMTRLRTCLSESQNRSSDSLEILTSGNIPKELYQMFSMNRLPTIVAIQVTRLWVARFGYFRNSLFYARPQRGAKTGSVGDARSMLLVNPAQVASCDKHRRQDCRRYGAGGGAIFGSWSPRWQV
jgi:hypothetical protein